MRSSRTVLQLSVGLGPIAVINIAKNWWFSPKGKDQHPNCEAKLPDTGMVLVPRARRLLETAARITMQTAR